MRARLCCDAMTHPGRVRAENQDAFLERPDIGLWAVADGVGGQGGGGAAAARVVDALSGLPAGLPPETLLATVRKRLEAVHAALSTSSGATTLVALLAHDAHFACLWAGDSRGYLLRHGRLWPITRDHSLVQELVDRGTLPASAAATHPQANVILRAIGAEGVLELDKVRGRLEPGDRFLLCSDGLTRVVQDAEIRSLLAGPGGARALVEAALARGATDNVTAVVVHAPADQDAA
jgi:serine/threonine protein phosphatase PrpC